MVTILAELPASLSDFPEVSLSYSQQILALD